MAVSRGGRGNCCWHDRPNSWITIKTLVSLRPFCSTSNPIRVRLMHSEKPGGNFPIVSNGQSDPNNGPKKVSLMTTVRGSFWVGWAITKKYVNEPLRRFYYSNRMTLHVIDFFFWCCLHVHWSVIGLKKLVLVYTFHLYLVLGSHFYYPPFFYYILNTTSGVCTVVWFPSPHLERTLIYWSS